MVSRAQAAASRTGSQMMRLLRLMCRIIRGSLRPPDGAILACSDATGRPD